MRYLLLIVFVTMFGLHVSAQNDIRLPPVLEPSDIFAEGIEVIETLPVLYSADEAGIIYYLGADADSWHTFSFPDAAEADMYYYFERLLSDGTFLMTGEFALLFPGAYPDVYLRFDPFDQQFTRLYGECGRDEYREAGEWVLEEGDEGIFHLCNTATGQRTDPLPDEMQSKLFSDNYVPCVQISESPNRETLVIISCGRGVNFTLATASQITGIWEHVIAAPNPPAMSYNDSYSGSIVWQNDQEFLLLVRMHNAYIVEIYHFFIDDALNSVKLIPSGAYTDIQYLNDNIFSLLSVDLSIEQVDGKFSILEYNLATGQQRPLLNSKCNSLDVDCPDIYLRLVEGNDNLLIVAGRGPHPEFARPLGQTYKYWMVAIDTGEVVYESLTQPEPKPTSLAKAVWLGNERVYMLWAWETGTIVDMRSEETAPTVIKYVSNDISYDNRVVIQEHDRNFVTLNIYELDTGQTTPLTQPIDTTMYTVYTVWQEDGSISITFYDETRSCCNERLPLRRWIVRP